MGSSLCGLGSGAALGSTVQHHWANTRLDAAVMPKQDCCECKITWGQPGMKDGGRGRKREWTNALEIDFTGKNSLVALSDPSAQGWPFLKSCRMVTSLRVCALARTHRNITMTPCQRRAGSVVGGSAQLICMGCSFAALQSPFLLLLRVLAQWCACHWKSEAASVPAKLCTSAYLPIKLR